MKRFLTLCVLAASAAAAPTHWVDWTSASTGTVQGTITLPDSTTIGVTYTGQYVGAQTSGGTFYWNPASTWQSSTVDNAPGTSDIIRLTGGANTPVNRITFSQAVTNPVMAILSLGSGIQVLYDFDAPFDILSSGGSSSWGGGTLNELAGDVLQGYEGNGTIQFQGTFTSISWMCPTYENWHGFTVGLVEAAPIPAPGAIMLGGLGAVMVGWLRRRRTL